MKVQSVVVGDFEVNCYILMDDAQGALVIDPGADPEAVARVIEQHRLSVRAYLITHGHMDHVSGLADLVGLYPAPVAIHPKDHVWAFTDRNEMLPYYATPARPPRIERDLADGQEWTDGGFAYRVIETPGHSPGSVCFHFPEQEALFTGDTLFAGSVGRTDLAGGDDRLLNESLRVLARLPDATVVFPGHGPKSTIGQEKATNPFLRYRV